MTLRLLCLGDVVGRAGRSVLAARLPGLIRDLRVDVTIANGENVAGGSGITPNLFHKLRSFGCDVITLGDHVYKRQEIVPVLQGSERILRPANLASVAAGRGCTVITTNSGEQVAVFCLLGRIYMNLPADDPFACADRIVRELPGSVKVIVCDMHAEATSEKVAMGHHLDGRVSVVFGTHTHVPTADARVLPGGTAVITDVGMCGPYDSVLGRRKERILKYMTSNMPTAFEMATSDVRMCGMLAEINTSTGRAVSVERVEVRGESVDKPYDSDDARGKGASD